MTEPRARATLKDVARQAGVSVTTVSVVLNDKRDGVRVPEATRARVLDAARELGYRPNQMARGLRAQTSRAVGFLSAQAITTPFAVDLLAAAQQVATAHDNLLFVVDVGTAADPAALESAMDSLLQHQVASFVVACNFHQYVETVSELPASTVFVNGRPRGGSFRSIVPDERRAAFDAVSELLGQGHRRVAFLDDNSGTIASGLRHRGYLDALAAHDIDPDPRLHAVVDSMVRGGSRGAELLDLPERQRPTGVFCFNDHMAMGLYRAARARGLRIPADLSVVGFDDHYFIASELDPPLTTMRLPHWEMGEIALKTVLGEETPGLTWTRDEDGVVLTLVECPIVRRESVGPPPA